MCAFVHSKPIQYEHLNKREIKKVRTRLETIEFRIECVCVGRSSCATGELKNALNACKSIRMCVGPIATGIALCKVPALAHAFIGLVSHIHTHKDTGTHKSHDTLLRIHSLRALCRPDQFKNMEMKMRHSTRIRHRSRAVFPTVFSSRWFSCYFFVILHCPCPCHIFEYL